jgi:hypothetical protein
MKVGTLISIAMHTSKRHNNIGTTPSNGQALGVQLMRSSHPSLPLPQLNQEDGMQSVVPNSILLTRSVYTNDQLA